MAERRNASPPRRLTATERAQIGHNMGPPLDAGPSWGLYCWRQAHKKAWKSPPIEVVRQRCRRAEAMGLTYRELTSVILNTGSQVQALLFWLAPDRLQLRRAGAAAFEPTPAVAAKLCRPLPCRVVCVVELPAALRGADRAALAGAADERLRAICGGAFAGCRLHAPALSDDAGGRRQETGLVRDLLGAARLAASGTVMVGDGQRARNCSEAAFLPLFVPADDYFARP